MKEYSYYKVTVNVKNRYVRIFGYTEDGEKDLIDFGNYTERTMTELFKLIGSVIDSKIKSMFEDDEIEWDEVEDV